MKKRIALLLVLIFLAVTILLSCGNDDAQARNLQKLCKVWGFAKYTHQVFLLGLKDWDNELFELIPVILSAKENEVNDILYEWFIGLGDDGYENVPAETETDEKNLRYMADKSWITTEYLGEPLAAILSRFKVIPDINRANAPVSFDNLNNSVFSNEKPYKNMDYKDNGYRLLGLFRLWNALEYYYPYLDIIDGDWSELLLKHIPMMLNGTDKQSYESTLASLAAKTDDAHIGFSGESINERYKQALLRNFIPSPTLSHVLLENNIGLINPSKLRTGEIHGIMKDFAGTDGLIVDFRQYPSDFLPYSLAQYLVDEHQPFAFMSNPLAAVPGVFEDNAPIYSGRFAGDFEGQRQALLDLYKNDLEEARQYYLSLNENKRKELRVQYLIKYDVDIGHSLDEFMEIYIESLIKQFINIESYYYDKKVVLIMDEMTMSQPEFTIMSLRNGSNVTVIGRNSIGADGNVIFLPLPGGIRMSYTGLGVYYPDGGQTQRIGLSPDIYIKQTTKDTDELMEAAVQFILGN